MEDPQEQKRWREALQLVGRTAVQDHLRTYPGNSSDPFYDLPLHPPYPPREFCQAWCAETDSDLMRGHGRVILLAVFIVVVFACIIAMLISSMSPTSSGTSMFQSSPQQLSVPRR
jgi:hypothetical protein